MSAIRDKMLSLADRIEEYAAHAIHLQTKAALFVLVRAIRDEFGVVKSVVHIDCSKPKKRKRK